MTPSLPVELYIQILKELPGGEYATVTTIVSFLAVGGALRAAALEESVWERLYRSHYTHCDEAKEAERRDRLQGDFRLMFIERYQVDSKGLRLANLIRAGQCDRLAVTKQVAQELSFDVWDALGREASIPIPKVFRDPATDDMDEEPAPHALPRRFWAQALKGAMARYQAFRTWVRIGLDDQECTFDDVLLGFSAFIDVAPQDSLAQLDELYTRCRQELVGQGRVLDPDTPGYDLPGLVVAIREFMHNEGFSLPQRGALLSPLSQFPPHLLGPGRSTTLPMSMNWVFAAICRRLGIRAGPTNTPMKVLCHITSPDPQKGDMIFDVCGSDPPITFSSKDPTVMLAEAGMPSSSRPDAVLPASLSLMVRRAAENIFNVTRAPPGVWGRAVEPIWRADYAASAVVVALGSRWEAYARQRRLFEEAPPTCPLDEPVFVDVLNEYSSQRRDGDVGRRPTFTAARPNSHPPRRRPHSVFVPFVGQACSTGCTIGWKVVERADGPPQRVHYVLTPRGILTPHLHDENPLPTELLTPLAARSFRQALIPFDRYVEDAAIPRGDGLGGRFVPTLELQAEYPDDLEYGERWTDIQLGVHN